ncbi:MAG: hypothetical protein KQI78_12595 [Deltaproteobacteria bacterium]|nr:hypothetical protein [Deltaproteobacteria bacterium]
MRIFKAEPAMKVLIKAVVREMPGSIRNIGGAVAARLRNQLKEAADFRAGLFIEECFVFFLGQSMF